MELREMAGLRRGEDEERGGHGRADEPSSDGRSKIPPLGRRRIGVGHWSLLSFFFLLNSAFDTMAISCARSQSGDPGGIPFIAIWALARAIFGLFSRLLRSAVASDARAWSPSRS